MQATRELGLELLPSKAITSLATVSAVKGSYQNWLSLQSSATKVTFSPLSSCPVSSLCFSTFNWFCSSMNSLRAARAWELSIGRSSSSSSSSLSKTLPLLGFSSSSSIPLVREAWSFAVTDGGDWRATARKE